MTNDDNEWIDTKEHKCTDPYTLQRRLREWERYHDEMQMKNEVDRINQNIRYRLRVMKKHDILTE